jgi:subtilase family serine protease
VLLPAWMRRGAALAAAVALTLSTAATPAPPAPSTAHPYTLPANVKNVCAWPPPVGHASCLALVRTDIVTHRGLVPDDAGDPPGYSPTDLQSAYNLPSATAGKGQTVAILDAYDDPDAESDLATYRSQFNLPPCTTKNGCFKKYNEYAQNSHYPATDGDWAGEISLDLDMVSAICPNCHIALVEADSNSTPDLAETSDNIKLFIPAARFISNSYGGPLDPEYPPSYYHQHWGGDLVTTASTGDSGYGVEWPAADSDVVAVGGTSLQRATNARGWDEIAWSGAGSGCSTDDKPAWQHDTGCSHRSVADVAAVADPSTGVAVYDSVAPYSGGWTVFGGTSVASPIIASVFALAGPETPGYFRSPLLYKRASMLNDIVAGRNYFGPCTPDYSCHAVAGYDGPTGLGTPNGIGAFNPKP